MRTMLSKDAIHESIREQVQNYHADVVSEAEEAVKNNRIVVVGMRWNDSVWR